VEINMDMFDNEAARDISRMTDEELIQLVFTRTPNSALEFELAIRLETHLLMRDEPDYGYDT
jgi:hypothetical protein